MVMHEVLEPEWYDDAACRGHGWFEFFDAADPTAAQRVCTRCPVRRTCFEFAMRERIPFGIWGGCTPEQRTRARASMRAA